MAQNADSRPSSSTSDASSALGWPATFPMRSLKRQNEYLGSDLEYPQNNKSRRPTPSTTGATSPVSTTGSGETNVDPMRTFIGADFDRALEEHRKVEEELARQQEELRADEEYARSLQKPRNSLAGGYRAPLQNQSNSGLFRQATISPQGTLSMPVSMPPPALRPVKPEPSITIDDDSDSDIELVTASEWTPNVRRPPQLLQFPSSHSFSSMPGSFPGTASYGGSNDQFAGMGGTSVYRTTTSQVVGSGDMFMAGTPVYQRSTFPSQLIGYGDMFMAGTPGLPIDVDDHDGDDSPVGADISAFIANIRPDEEVSSEQRVGTPDEMDIQLMPHQKLGLAWMLKMEEGSNKGGILADDMGLGKTIQALALIVSNKPLPQKPRTTLIVAPVALMHQWDREAFNVLKKQHRLRVFTLHGSHRRISPHAIKMYDIVLTTYGSLASEFKRWLEWQQKIKMYPDAIPSDKERCLILGNQVRFHRVILDEAQCIKNRNTKAAHAACLIQAEYRWCLTGTPMQNSVDEFQSLLKFTRIPPFNRWEKFSLDIARPLKARVSDAQKDRAMRQLQGIIRATTLRRTKNSIVDGKPLLRLPPKTVSESRAVFSDDERDFYTALESQSQLQFNKYLKAGTIGRNYSNVLVLLLRLRQACCHPHLIRDIAINTGGVEGLDFVNNARELPKVVIARLRDLEAVECPVCFDATENALITNPCGHTLCEECLSKIVDSATNNEDGGSGPVPKCPSCRAKIDTTKTTDHQSFLRVFCPEREGVLPLDDDEVVTDSSDDSDSEVEENEDDDSDGDLKDFIVPDDDETLYNTENEDKKPLKYNLVDMEKLGGSEKKHKTSKKSKGKRKAKSKDDYANKSLAQLRKEGLRNKKAKKLYLRRLQKDFQSSTKIDQTLALLESIHLQNPTDKTLIFSGFTTFLDLLEVPLSHQPNLANYVRYDGSMTAKDRTAAVEYFSDTPECKVMLISLKAGNAGLNLTKANHVIVMDPHWNYYTEAQAIDRAHRLGQTKPVSVHRMIVDSAGLGERGSVEDRILTLQEKKRDLVENALDENAGRNIARLGVRELGYLFGVNGM